MVEEPFHYEVEGMPHRYLVFRTEQVEGKRVPLLSLVPDDPNATVLEVLSLYLDDMRLKMAPRREAIANYRGVEVYCLIGEEQGIGEDRVMVEVYVSEPDAKRRNVPHYVAYARAEPTSTDQLNADEMEKLEELIPPKSPEQP